MPKVKVARQVGQQRQPTRAGQSIEHASGEGHPKDVIAAPGAMTKQPREGIDGDETEEEPAPDGAGGAG
jgi:hypothetical protein